MKQLSSLLLFLGFISAGNLAFAQNNNDVRLITASKISGSIQLDGLLSEAAWEETIPSSGFFQRFPADTGLAESQTEVRILYNQHSLYVGVICHDPLPGKYVVSSLQRDFSGFGNDYFSLILDPFMDQINAFEFAVNPYGAQREGLIANGGNGRNATSNSWDNKWYSKVRSGKDHWVIEMAIPFKTLRYREGSTEWRINFARNDYKRNERSNWTQIPRNFQHTNLAYTGFIRFEAPLPKPGMNLSLIPYLTGGYSKNQEEQEAAQFTWGLGGDVKVGLGPALNLDLTFNPDFSQVEVDRQVTNLDRFEIFFPERRQFFQENADLFAAFGADGMRPFFSRRIGIAKDTVSSDNVANPILGGARLSGKLNENWRVGLLNVQTEADADRGIMATNYTVAAVQRKLFTRSNIGAILVNRENFETQSDSATLPGYQRVVGLDYNLASADNTWNGKVFYHRVFQSDQVEGAFSHGANLSYDTRTWEISWDHQWVGKGYDALVGFVRRNDYRRINPKAEYKIYPAKGPFNRLSWEIEQDLIWTGDLGLTDRVTSLDMSLRFTGASFMRFGYENEYVKLFDDFDPTRTDGQAFLAGSEIVNQGARFFYLSDYRKPVNFTIRGSIGSYYTGFRTSVGGDITYRFPPFGTLSIDYTFNQINLPDPYNDASLWLLGPRLELVFSQNMFLTTLLQYNSQRQRLNLNARFQWRYAPASDLFIVYTDNYNTEGFQGLSRGLVFKLTYWLNV